MVASTIVAGQRFVQVIAGLDQLDAQRKSGPQQAVRQQNVLLILVALSQTKELLAEFQGACGLLPTKGQSRPWPPALPGVP